MLTYEREREIHKLFDSGATFRAIQRQTGVTADAIARIAKARKINDSTPESVRSEIYALVMAGLSPTTVAKKLGLPRSHVIAVRQVTMLRAMNSAEPTKCPTCGGVILPKAREDYTPATPPSKICDKHARELFVLANDLIGIASEYLVPNLLFYNLAKTARNLIGEICGEEKNSSR